MKCNNAFFKQDDARLDTVAGFKIPPGWWSRPHEYAWAMDQEIAGIIADMGAGQFYRPLRDAMAEQAMEVFAVDSDARLQDQDFPSNVFPIVADFTKEIPAIDEGECDAIFCISVLEDVQDRLGALREFKRCLRPGGKIYITMDVRHNDQLPDHPKYKGIRLAEFMEDVEDAGLAFSGDPVDSSRENAISNAEFNLTVFHCILQAAE